MTVRVRPLPDSEDRGLQQPSPLQGRQLLHSNRNNLIGMHHESGRAVRNQSVQHIDVADDLVVLSRKGKRQGGGGNKQYKATIKKGQSSSAGNNHQAQPRLVRMLASSPSTHRRLFPSAKTNSTSRDGESIEGALPGNW